jgi:hypothetical protein
MVAARFAVSVLVIVCTTTGAPPPIWTPPTFTERSEATDQKDRSLRERLHGPDAAATSLAGMRRTTLAVVLATGALAVPAVAFAAGGDDQTPQQTPQTAPVQQQEQPQQRPDRGDCPEHDGSGGGSGTAPSPTPESGSGSGDTLL